MADVRKYGWYGAAIIGAELFAATAASADDTGFGKVGDPVKLTVGYQPWYTESWSGVLMKAKGFWKKYLPPGSAVTFEPGLQGSVVVGKMIAGEEQIGYLGDMPAIVASAKPEAADIRIVATVGTSEQQCNIFLVRKDAPEFKSAEEGVKWFDGKTVATPHGSCADRFARKVFQKLGVKPAKYFNQGADAIAENLKDGKLDAVVVWEPISSKFIADGVARRIASGVNFSETDAAFLAMRQDFMAARPDVEKAWLDAELDAELFLADPKNAGEIAKIAESEAQGYSAKTMWHALYADHPAAIGGGPNRLTLDFIVTDNMKTQVGEANAFLFELKRVPAARLRGDAFADDVARKVLEERHLTSPIGIVKSQSDTAATQ